MLDRKPWMYFFIACGTLCFVPIAGFAFCLISMYAVKPQVKSFTIKLGQPFYKVADMLVKSSDSGFVLKKSCKACLAVQYFLMPKEKYNPGWYAVKKNQRLLPILFNIKKGKSEKKSFTIIEGSNAKDAIMIINSNSYLDGEDVVDVKEGSILPETYFFDPGTTKSAAVLRAQKSMLDALNSTWKDRREDFPLSKFEALTLASIVEKETAGYDKKRKIAGVIMNRLRRNMRLQLDPSVEFIYYTKHNRKIFRLSKKDINDVWSDPYNLYSRKGLPPGPISLPSKESIAAVLNYEDNNYLYYVGYDGIVLYGKDHKDHIVNRQLYEKSLKKNKTKKA